MRKKILIMSMFCLAAMTIKAEPVHQYEDSIIHQKSFSQEPMLLSGNPTYLKNVLQMESVKTKKATKMVAYKQLQKRFASMVRRSIYRCKKCNLYFCCL